MTSDFELAEPFSAPGRTQLPFPIRPNWFNLSSIEGSRRKWIESEFVLISRPREISFFGTPASSIDRKANWIKFLDFGKFVFVDVLQGFAHRPSRVFDSREVQWISTWPTIMQAFRSITHRWRVSAWTKFSYQQHSSSSVYENKLISACSASAACTQFQALIVANNTNSAAYRDMSGVLTSNFYGTGNEIASCHGTGNCFQF